MTASFHTVDGNGLQPFQLLEFAVIYKVHVRQIRNVPEPVAKYRELLDLVVSALDGDDGNR